MKQQLAIITLFLWVFTVGCKKDSSTIGEGYNIKTFNLKIDESFATKDNCFLVVNYSAGIIAKIDGNGNMLWKKTNIFKGRGNIVFGATISAPVVKFSFSEKFITVWFVSIDDYKPGPGFKQHLEITKLDLNGNVIVQKSVKPVLPFFPILYYNAIELESGEYIFAINYNEPAFGQDYSVIVSKFDENCLLKWERGKYFSNQNSTLSFDACSQLVRNSDSTFLVISSSSNNQLKIYTYNFSGVFKATKDISAIITTPSTSYYMATNTFKNLSLLSTGNIVAVGSCYNPTFGVFYLHHLELEPNFVLKNNVLPADKYYTCYALSSNELFLAGVSQNYSTAQSSLVTKKVSLPLFEALPPTNYPELGSFSVVGCMINKDRTYSIIGTSTFNKDANHLLFLKLNSDGTLIK